MCVSPEGVCVNMWGKGCSLQGHRGEGFAMSREDKMAGTSKRALMCSCVAPAVWPETLNEWHAIVRLRLMTSHTCVGCAPHLSGPSSTMLLMPSSFAFSKMKRLPVAGRRQVGAGVGVSKCWQRGAGVCTERGRREGGREEAGRRRGQQKQAGRSRGVGNEGGHAGRRVQACPRRPSPPACSLQGS